MEVTSVYGRDNGPFSSVILPVPKMTRKSIIVFETVPFKGDLQRRKKMLLTFSVFILDKEELKGLVGVRVEADCLL